MFLIQAAQRVQSLSLSARLPELAAVQASGGEYFDKFTDKYFHCYENVNHPDTLREVVEQLSTYQMSKKHLDT